MQKSIPEKIIKNLLSELQRGIITVVVLEKLSAEEYGYTLLDKLNTLGFTVDQNSLYPLLRRLEEQKLLESTWKVEKPRPRKYYKRSNFGNRVLEAAKQEIIKQYQLLKEEVL
jgi:DNA-binding PadR family transcriptional regulator